MGSSEAVQNYEIYINDSVLSLRDQQNALKGLNEQYEAVQLRYVGQVKTLLNAIDNLEKTKTRRHISIVGEELNSLFKDFISLFRWIEAGGGVVENKKGEILAIYRRNMWDLPKGKLDPGETFEEAAIREVIEETGLRSVTSHNLVSTSLHVFRTRRNERALKMTKWYAMSTRHTDFQLQYEEDIEDAVWIKPEAFLKGKYRMYRSIRTVVEQYISYKKVNT